MSDDATEREELLESGHRQPHRRTWLALAVTAVIVAVGAAFFLTRSGDEERPRAKPTSPAASSTPSVVGSAVPRPVCLDVGDSALNCGVSATLPRPVLLATRTVLPAATVVSATTVTGRDGRVVSRRVIVHDARDNTLQVRIGAANGERSGLRSDDGLSVQYATDVNRRHVEISVRTSPGTPAPAVAALQKLALDPRLFTVG